MKIITQKKMLILLILLLCSLSFNLVFAVSVSVPEPGSEQDPIVSKSYVDASIEDLKKENAEMKKLLASQEEFIKKLTDEIVWRCW